MEIIGEGRGISEIKWGDCILDENFWEEPNDIWEAEEIEGFLSDRMIENRLSLLAKCRYEDSYALTKCNLSRLNLVDIMELRKYKYLQYLNLSYNNINDLSPLEEFPYLTHLDVSHNNLTSATLSTPPLYLTHMNLSHNKITTIHDMSGFWSIIYLDLSHNSIELVSGLQNLKYLKYLDLSHNLIDCVRNLDDLNIEKLNLEFNRIAKFHSSPGEGLDNLRKLRILILNHNKISSLFFLHNAFYSLRIIDLGHNKIGDLLGVSNARAFLEEIDLRGNTCNTWPFYREVLLHAMPTLTCIDGCEVAVSEKISALAKFSPPVDLLASKALSRLILLEHLIPPIIHDNVIPYDQPDPVLVVLSGPSAVKKIILGLRIAKRMPDKVKYCRSYTTREFSAHEEARAYKFIDRENFNAMARNGEFLTVEELVGDSYGFHAEEIGILRKENKIGITQMDLGATIQLKHRYPNVKIILVMVNNEEIHEQWIRDKFKIFTWIKDSVENLLALTIGRLSRESNVESAVSKQNFVSQIISEIIQDLDLPNYCNYVRPQGTGATAMDIILQSRMMLGRVTKTAKEIITEKHIQFQNDPGSDERQENILQSTFSDLKE
ncbi:leucine-rich repeat and guanylate kinase domain-containing protein isoform X2 [Fopius arisanus]|uniref:Leucine-rich repeat and guanylate kinase domain-containing protein isoform X2 n=1 Tax=Fopius arisanus TaxID=64838 RepID=A0A9R1TZ18_9HYME|nr:PREDICTED: leucine-rich repeat and guanylate kinase domain-containing protein-like isoform X2 [Fopius arisanus]